MKSKQPWHSKIKVLFICLALAGCGVKGRPQAPTTPTPAGYGSPEADALQIKKKQQGSNP